MRDYLRAMERKPMAELAFKRPWRAKFPVIEEALWMWHLQAESQIKVSTCMLIEKG